MNTKRIILKGKVVSGVGDARYRIKQLADIFKKKIPTFDDFSKIGGTLNIKLQDAYPKKIIQGSEVIRFESNDIPKMRNQNGYEYPEEGFTFIPVYKIQGEETSGYIYSPDCTANTDDIIVMANFKIRDKYNLKDGDYLSIETIIS